MICKSCAEAADVFLYNVKEWGLDSALTAMAFSLHRNCEYTDCYCQHTVERGAYVDK